LNLVISENKLIPQPSYKNLKFIGELAFVREVLYCRIANLKKRTEIDNKSDAVHGEMENPCIKYRN
jgi:hypothetical protein